LLDQGTGLDNTSDRQAKSRSEDVEGKVDAQKIPVTDLDGHSPISNNITSVLNQDIIIQDDEKQ